MNFLKDAYLKTCSGWSWHWGFLWKFTSSEFSSVFSFSSFCCL